jgi:RNA polymerase sigma-70 factor (ECF subfamily)
MGMDEAKLIERWRQGEDAAFAELVQHWQGPIARLFGRLGSGPAAADLSQEVFLRVYQARDRYRDSGRFAGWLYRIALNVLRDARRRQGCEQPATGSAALECAGREATPAAACERDESARLVNRAVEELPEPLRLVLVLRHYEGLTFEEMAALLDAPPSTLKSRFARALAAVRDRLEPLLDIHRE